MVAFGLVLAGLCVFIIIRFWVNWLQSQPEQPIRVKPQPNQTGRGRIIRE